MKTKQSTELPETVIYNLEHWRLSCNGKRHYAISKSDGKRMYEGKCHCAAKGGGHAGTN